MHLKEVNPLKNLQTRKRTPFAVELDIFRARHGLLIKQIAAQADVSYASLIDVCRGRSPGVSILPKVRAWMARYEADHPIQSAAVNQ